MPSVVLTLNYYVPPSDRPAPYVWAYRVDPVTGKPDQGHGQGEHGMEIEDIRGKEEEYTLDRNGFQIYRRSSKHTEFVDNAMAYSRTLPHFRDSEWGRHGPARATVHLSFFYSESAKHGVVIL
ncbi:hypothetical protein OE88DRAFT_1737111 [Heliocybe sulcata]|uniref:Uncharacterized protein n=1 Tax=Heliocybe sulcata TaxID=5364 RepID=A0A5C3MVK6_9AGAM|nr:hypothetical protein OE88DRAFT_1737111 [Heliocybe sulcata]